MMKKFSDKSYNAKSNAQRNLSGLTHWADDATLKFFSCRISSAYDDASGLILCVKYSQAEGFHGGKTYGAIVFDVMGNAVHDIKAPTIAKRDKEAHTLFAQCVTHADLITRTAIESQIRTHTRAIEYLREQLGEFA